MPCGHGGPAKGRGRPRAFVDVKWLKQILNQPRRKTAFTLKGLYNRAVLEGRAECTYATFLARCKKEHIRVRHLAHPRLFTAAQIKGRLKYCKGARRINHRAIIFVDQLDLTVDTISGLVQARLSLSGGGLGANRSSPNPRAHSLGPRPRSWRAQNWLAVWS
jgi:hypothetical protein